MLNTGNFNAKRLEEAINNYGDSQGHKTTWDWRERKERVEKFKKLFSEKFDEAILSEIIKNLWASLIWGNKDYLVNNIIQSNGLDKLESAFKKLVSADGAPGQRYETFTQSIKYMGPAMVTEILCLSDSTNAGIWNDKARKALAWLEAKDAPYSKYKISGEEYNHVNLLLKDIAGILHEKLSTETDLFFVDYFLWFVTENLISNNTVEVKQVDEKVRSSGQSRHNELRDKVAEIGAWLGFEADIEKTIAPGTKLDVSWTTHIGNLGSVAYVFEVQDRGSIDSLLLNLQRAQSNPIVQKLIVVSDSIQIEKIKKECTALPEAFKRSIAYWDADEVDSTHEHLGQVSTSIAKLNLVADTFK